MKCYGSTADFRKAKFRLTLEVSFPYMKLLRVFTASVIVIIFFNSPLKAQNNTGTCGWISATKNEENKNPVLFARQKVAAQKKINDYLQSHRNQTNDTLYTLPIVVHVINIGGAVGAQDNPTDASINNMITELNNAWRINGAQYGGPDIKIQFQLAIRSPQCGTTNGIIRMNGSSVPNYVSGGIAIGTAMGCADEVAVKNLSRWPNTDYINIWVVHKILGSSTGTGGFAYFAENNSSDIDGITINADYVGFNPTIVHEMGHVFELFHTFHDDAYETTCPRTDSCAFYGDEVCDTEGGLVEYDCNNTTNSCTAQLYLTEDVPHSYTVLNNYMNYTNCPEMFTQGQKDRMRAALFTFRHGLISSGALSPPPTSFPAAACIPTADHGRSFYYGVQKMEFNTLSVYSNSSIRDSATYVDRSCNQRTTVIKGQTYQLIITGSYFNPCWFKAYIDYNNDGDFNDAGESLIPSTMYNFSGTDTVNVTIPSTGIITGIPLRLRVIAEDPSFEPTACHLTGTALYGAGQAEDYAIVIANRQIVSATSGPWNIASTWTCNCIPQADDEVTIKPTYTITITPAMGQIQCVKLNLEAGSFFNVSGSFKTTGN